MTKMYEYRVEVEQGDGAAVYRQAAQRVLRWVPGTRLTVHDWVLLLQGSGVPQFEALGWGLEYGVRTGRFPCWERSGYDQVLTGAQGAALTAVQARRLFAQAAYALDGVCSTAAALQALQAAWGVRVR